MKNDDFITLIYNKYLEVLAYAKAMKLQTDNIKIFILPRIADALELKDSFPINCKGREWAVPIIRDNGIREEQMEDGSFTSTIYIWDFEWGKNE